MDDVLALAHQDPPLVTGLWLYEVCNALAVGVRRNRLTDAAAAEAVDLLSSVPVRIVQLGWLDMRSAFRIAGEHGLSVYDASYLYLARHTELPLLTLDKRMKEAAAAMGLG